MNDLLLLRAAPHDRIAALVGHGVSAALVGRMVRSARLEARLSSLVAARLGPLGDVDAGGAAVLAMTADERLDLAGRAGAVWHGAAIARVIDTPSHQALVTGLGGDGYGAALAGRHLAQVTAFPDLSPEAILRAVARDGIACFAAWCDTRSPALADRLRLVGPAAPAEAVHRASGPAIVAWLLERRP